MFQTLSVTAWEATGTRQDPCGPENPNPAALATRFVSHPTSPVSHIHRLLQEFDGGRLRRTQPAQPSLPVPRQPLQGLNLVVVMKATLVLQRPSFSFLLGSLYECRLRASSLQPDSSDYMYSPVSARRRGIPCFGV